VSSNKKIILISAIIIVIILAVAVPVLASGSNEPAAGTSVALQTSAGTQYGSCATVCQASYGTCAGNSVCPGTGGCGFGGGGFWQR
jgi:hypothetical protein